jgi:nitrogen regulatory protein PII-like uncharacterized protein
MWALILAIYVSDTSVAVSSQTIQGFSSQQDCEVAGKRVLDLSRGHRRANVIYTCVQVK